MLLEKLLGGVLRVLTPLGPRYVKPALVQRIYLLWIFRHFQVLPLQVLTPRQRRVIDALCAQADFVSVTQANGWDPPILGTLEPRPPMPASSTQDSASEGRGDVSPFAADMFRH